MKNLFINPFFRDPVSADYGGFNTVDEMYASMGVSASDVMDATPTNYSPTTVTPSVNWWDTAAQIATAAGSVLGVANANQNSINGRSVVYSNTASTATSKTTILLVSVLVVAIVVTVIVFMRKKK